MGIEKGDGWTEGIVRMTPYAKDIFGDYASLQITLLLSLNYDLSDSPAIAEGTITKIHFDEVTLQTQ